MVLENVIQVDMNMYECFHVSKCANYDINSTLMTLEIERYIKTQRVIFCMNCRGRNEDKCKPSLIPESFKVYKRLLCNLKCIEFLRNCLHWKALCLEGKSLLNLERNELSFDTFTLPQSVITMHLNQY